MKKALLIIDVQNDYFDKGSMPLTGAEESAKNIKKILELFRRKGLPVIHIQHLAVRPGATFFIPGTNGAEIHDLVQPLENEKLIIKNYPNSFRETELLPYLKTLGITDLVICGMMTHMCVDATVRAAKDFGFNNLLITDGCATKDLEANGHKVFAEQVHHAFLAALGYFYAGLTTTESFLEEELQLA